MDGNDHWGSRPWKTKSSNTPWPPSSIRSMRRTFSASRTVFDRSAASITRRKWAQGEVVVIRFADDTILGFQYQTDADRFLENLRERLAKFGLELHPEKTRRIEFGRFAEENRKRRAEDKPETFDFLGFTHI